ncbi:MAG TPA: hypothetical protein DDZ40_11300 [Deltaproteobacteria bacterium]|nr:hypothetical protein [Deltaproteobacteria bacterium]
MGYSLQSQGASGILGIKGKVVPAKKKTLYYTEPLFEEFKKDYCYVCGQRIKENEGLYVGKSTWRHKRCKPGSAHWLRSSLAKDEATLTIFKS